MFVVCFFGSVLCVLCCVFVVCCLLFVVCCLLFVVCCSVVLLFCCFVFFCFVYFIWMYEQVCDPQSFSTSLRVVVDSTDISSVPQVCVILTDLPSASIRHIIPARHKRDDCQDMHERLRQATSAFHLVCVSISRE